MGRTDKGGKTSFSQSIEEFVEASPWLGSADAPALATLRYIADAIDAGAGTPAMIAQLGLTHRSLLKRAPKAVEVASPLAAALEEAAK